MQFVRVADWQAGIPALIKRLKGELSGGKHVLWLVSGGSNVTASIAVMEALPEDITTNLVIMLTDERYGEVGHIHSNAKQLHDAGLMTKQAVFIQTLEPGFTLEETRERYEHAAGQAFAHADVVIGQFGIGADGHIAGILPQSPATEADGWVAAYHTQEHTRVTLTFQALRHVDAGYAFAFGTNKAEALNRLKTEARPLAEQPSQILKELSEAYVYNDQVGGTT